MNRAHVFQNKYTGLQMFVYHQTDEERAFAELAQEVLIPDNWIYLGQKIAEDTK